jgi:hypothetical protein
MWWWATAVDEALTLGNYKKQDRLGRAGAAPLFNTA